MTSHIKLYGSKSDRFEQIKAELEDRLGYEPSNPEVVGLLMSKYDSNERRSGTTYRSTGTESDRPTNPSLSQ